MQPREGKLTREAGEWKPAVSPLRTAGHYNLLPAVACAVSAHLTGMAGSCSHGPVGRLNL